jgi:hypothetical protein
MFTNRQFRRSQQKSISIFPKKINSWKVRSINGFEKYLFPNTQISTQSILKHRLNTKIDPARFIYPRDAMGNMLNRSTSPIIPFYLPKYDFIKTHSPVWTIKNVYHSKRTIGHVSPMTYNSVNDKSQLSCKFGWTQTGRRAFHIQLGLTVPFYDTRKYKEVGDSCSVGLNLFLNVRLILNRNML